MSHAHLSDEVAKHAGLVMTHAAAIASLLSHGELVCPFAVIVKGADRQSIEFEAATQDDAIAEGWASLDKFRDQVDLWALAREGLVRGANGKEDALVVAAWAPGMDDPAVFLQRFLPKARGGFALVGPIEARGQPEENLDRIGKSFVEGVQSHPKGHMWSTWHRHDV